MPQPKASCITGSADRDPREFVVGPDSEAEVEANIPRLRPRSIVLGLDL